MYFMQFKKIPFSTSASCQDTEQIFFPAVYLIASGPNEMWFNTVIQVPSKNEGTAVC